jgi:uncharacterized membrane protein
LIAPRVKTAARSRAGAIYSLLLLISLAWLGAIIAAPYLLAENHLTSSSILYQFFSSICHQIPDRSFHYWGYPLGVCSRCTGIYGGFLAGLLLYPLLRSVRNGRFPARWWLIAATIPMVLDFAVDYTKILGNTFSSRTLTGLLFGSVAAFFILPGFIAAFHADNADLTVDPYGG